MYREDYQTYSIEVAHSGLDYVVVFKRPTTRVGTGPILTGYDSENLAEAAARKFHEVYQYVQSVGLILDFRDEPSFTNDVGRSIPVRVALHMERDQLRDAIIAINRHSPN